MIAAAMIRNMIVFRLRQFRQALIDAVRQRLTFPYQAPANDAREFRTSKCCLERQLPYVSRYSILTARNFTIPLPAHPFLPANPVRLPVPPSPALIAAFRGRG